MSRATGRGSDSASPDLTRRAVARYVASCPGVHSLGFRGRSSVVMTASGVVVGGEADDGSVSARLRRRRGVLSSSLPSPSSSILPDADGNVNVNEGGTGSGEGDPEPSDALYLCVPRRSTGPGCCGERLGLLGADDDGT